MRELVELLFAFFVLISGVVLAPLAGVAVVRIGEIAGINPGATLLLAIFGFLAIVIAGWEILTRHDQQPDSPTTHKDAMSRLS